MSGFPLPRLLAECFQCATLACRLKDSTDAGTTRQLIFRNKCEIISLLASIDYLLKLNVSDPIHAARRSVRPAVNFKQEHKGLLAPEIPHGLKEAGLVADNLLKIHNTHYPQRFHFFADQTTLFSPPRTPVR